MRVYAQLGYCHRLQKDHEKALAYFKKQLEVAWEQRDEEGELNAYDNMGLEYFYLGDIEKSSYYHDRMVRGKVESDSSVIKSVTMNLLANKRSSGVKNKKADFERKQQELGLSKSIKLLPFWPPDEEDPENPQGLGVLADPEANYTADRRA